MPSRLSRRRRSAPGTRRIKRPLPLKLRVFVERAKKLLKVREVTVPYSKMGFDLVGEVTWDESYGLEISEISVVPRSKCAKTTRTLLALLKDEFPESPEEWLGEGVYEEIMDSPEAESFRGECEEFLDELEHDETMLELGFTLNDILYRAQ